MGLPYAVEYLLALERPGGGRVVESGFSQIIIPVFPPNTAVTLLSTPLGSDHGSIRYYVGFGPAMVPGAVSARLQQYGASYSGVATSWLFSGLFPLEGFVSVTVAAPSITTITNLTNFNQYYESISFFLRVATLEDWAFIREALTRLGTSAKSEEHAGEANRLLRVMAGKPQPPRGGS